MNRARSHQRPSSASHRNDIRKFHRGLFEVSGAGRSGTTLGFRSPKSCIASLALGLLTESSPSTFSAGFWTTTCPRLDQLVRTVHKTVRYEVLYRSGRPHPMQPIWTLSACGTRSAALPQPALPKLSVSRCTPQQTGRRSCPGAWSDLPLPEWKSEQKWQLRKRGVKFEQGTVYFTQTASIRNVSSFVLQDGVL